MQKESKEENNERPATFRHQKVTSKHPENVAISKMKTLLNSQRREVKKQDQTEPKAIIPATFAVGADGTEVSWSGLVIFGVCKRMM